MDTRSINPPPLVFKMPRRRLNTILLLFTLLLGFVRAQELIYTEVRTAQPVVAVGTELNLEVVLLDAFSEPIAAPETYDLSVEVYRDSSAGELLGVYNLTVAAGEELVPFTIPADRSGTFSIVATHPALISREFFVQVYDPSGGVKGAPFLASFRALGLVRASSAPPITDSFRVEILYSNSEPYLANGRSEVTLQFFLKDEAGNLVPAPDDLEIPLRTMKKGILSPNQIIIDKGNNSTTASLVSSQAGPVGFSFKANPTLRLVEGTSLEPVQFIYTGLHINPGPKASLLQPATLTVQLYGRNGNPVKAESNRKVIVQMTSGSIGNGVLKPVEATIKQNEFSSRVLLLPTWPGKIDVLASSVGIADADTSIQVTSALGWIFVALAGSVIGALVALINEVPSSKRTRTLVFTHVLKRIFVGVIVGSLLYWAYLFGVLLPPEPTMLLLHPFTAFFVTLIGAFIGVRVLNFIVNRFFPGLSNP